MAKGLRNKTVKKNKRVKRQQMAPIEAKRLATIVERMDKIRNQPVEPEMKESKEEIEETMPILGESKSSVVIEMDAETSQKLGKLAKAAKNKKSKKPRKKLGNLMPHL